MAICTILVYTNELTIDTEMPKHFGLGEKVVYTLTKRLHGKNHQVYCDNYFSSVPLADYLLCSYGLLPHILQPTRVTEHSATVIDNIFSNNIQDDIISGNILLTLSKHFSQFISVNREKIDIYQRDYSKFSNESFRDDVSIQTWNYAHENIHQAFKDFYTKLEGSISRHAPLKKLSPKEIKLKNKPWLSTDIKND